ncbi:MAG: glycosyltransferase family 1 protein [Candidatus Magasanikbacteria bacterium]
MNIVIDIRCLTNTHRTGVGEYTYELLNALFEFDTTNQYFLFYNSWKDVSDIMPQWKYKNVHCVATQWPNKVLNLFVWLGIVQLDTFIIQNSKFKIQKLDYFFSPNLNFISLTDKTKFILTVHDLSFLYFKHCFTWKQQLKHRLVGLKKLCKRADIILTPSENTRRDVVRHFGIRGDVIKIVRPRLNNVFSGHRPVISDQVRLKYGLPEKFILYLGTIEPRKNILSIIEAYKKSLLITDHCSLVIAGAKGWKCKKILKAMKNTLGVRYIGYVDPEDKPALYRLASLFVYPSLYEGYGLPVAEALACGTPVVTSNRSSLPEVGQGDVHLVNPYNIEEVSYFLAKFSQK